MLRRRPLRRHRTHDIHHYNNLPGFWLQRWVGGFVCFFLHTSSCICPRKQFAVTRRSRRALHTESAPHARAGFVQSLSAALGSGLLQAPHFAFWLLFHRSHTKSTASSCIAWCFVCNSVHFCSRTTSSNELPHLLPSSRARCALVHGIRCWLETSSHVLFRDLRDRC